LRLFRCLHGGGPSPVPRRGEEEEEEEEAWRRPALLLHRDVVDVGVDGISSLAICFLLFDSLFA